MCRQNHAFTKHFPDFNGVFSMHCSPHLPKNQISSMPQFLFIRCVTLSIICEESQADPFFMHQQTLPHIQRTQPSIKLSIPLYFWSHISKNENYNQSSLRRLAKSNASLDTVCLKTVNPFFLFFLFFFLLNYFRAGKKNIMHLAVRPCNMSYKSG